jgi:Protein of unknown function (DUF3500)
VASRTNPQVSPAASAPAPPGPGLWPAETTFAHGGLHKGGCHPFQDVEHLGPVQPGDVGQHDDRVDAEHKMQRGRQSGPGSRVKIVAGRGEDVTDPPAAAPGALVARLRVKRQPERGTQSFLVVQRELARLAGDRGGRLGRVGWPATVRRRPVSASGGPDHRLAEHQVLAGEVAVGGGPERTRWFYTPGDHGGLALAECAPAQRQAALRLLATGLSPAGYHLAAAIMSHELVLEHLEDWPVLPGWGRVRDPLRYYVAVFGDPGSADWAWRLAGHHLSLSYTIMGGELASPTPSFFGADPAEAPLPGGAVLRPLSALEDLGRELVRSLDEKQLAVALLAPQAPPDIVTGNRPVLEEGLWVAGPRELFRDADKLPQVLLDGLQARLAADEKALGPAVIRSLSWAREPAGVSWHQLRPGQREILTALLSAYLGRLPDTAAEAEHAKITGAAAGQLHFAWAGSTEPHRPHYYRVQGPRLLAEYDNTQRGANHVHTVWRDPDGDFGRDVLAAHYATSQ